MRWIFALGLTMILALGSLSGPVQAGSDFEDVSQVTLLPGWQRADGLYMAAVQVDLAPGWKTYWRAPGDNGIAPIFDWSGSGNLAQVGYFWPSPHIMDEKGIRTIGYKDQLILPILLRLRDPSQPVTLRLKMDYGICDEICLPAVADASLSADPKQVHNRDQISQALTHRSTPAASHGLQSATCRLSPDGEDFVLRAQFEFDQDVAGHRLVVVETGSDLIWVSEADHRLDGRSLEVEADLQYFGDGAMTLDRGRLKFTMLNDGQSIEIAGCAGG